MISFFLRELMFSTKEVVNFYLPKTKNKHIIKSRTKLVTRAEIM